MESELSDEISEDMLFEMYNDFVDSYDFILAAKCPNNLKKQLADAVNLLRIVKTGVSSVVHAFYDKYNYPDYIKYFFLL